MQPYCCTNWLHLAKKVCICERMFNILFLKFLLLRIRHKFPKFPLYITHNFLFCAVGRSYLIKLTIGENMMLMYRGIPP